MAGNCGGSWRSALGGRGIGRIVVGRRAPRAPSAPTWVGVRATAGDSDDIEAFRNQLQQSFDAENAEMKPITGKELQEISKEKWGCSYEMRIQKRGSKVFLHVMWKYLEQQSFPMTPEEYLEQLDAVAELLNYWECSDRIRKEMLAEKKKPGMTVGGGARAVQYIIF